MLVAFFGVGVVAGVSPLAEGGLDEAFGFAVGAGSVRTGEAMGDAEFLAMGGAGCKWRQGRSSEFMPGLLLIRSSKSTTFCRRSRNSSGSSEPVNRRTILCNGCSSIGLI